LIVNTKQAFEENENENKSHTQEISNEHESSSSNPIDLNRFYERAFFTKNGSIVEVILDNDILSWSIVSDESKFKILICFFFLLNKFA